MNNQLPENNQEEKEVKIEENETKKTNGEMVTRFLHTAIENGIIKDADITNARQTLERTVHSKEAGIEEKDVDGKKDNTQNEI